MSLIDWPGVWRSIQAWVSTAEALLVSGLATPAIPFWPLAVTTIWLLKSTEPVD
jgi:hypothetical protein